MTIRHLKIFLTVCECESMSRASQKLFVSQSSVSQAIAEIERNYQIQLFERLGKKLYITQEGKLLLDYAKRVIFSFDQMEKGMKNAAHYKSFVVGTTVTAGTCLINPLLDMYQREHSEMDIRVEVLNTDAIEEKILTSRLDIAIIPETEFSGDIVSRRLWTDELILCCSKRHPLAGKTVGIEEIGNEKFILRENGSGTRRMLEEYLEKCGFEMKAGWVCSNTDSIIEALRYNRGINFISKLLVMEELEKGELKTIQIKDIRFFRDFVLIYHKNKYINRNLEAFITLCTETDINALTSYRRQSGEEPVCW